MPNLSIKNIHEKMHNNKKQFDTILTELELTKVTFYKLPHLFLLDGKILNPKKLKTLPLDFDKKRLKGPVGYDDPIDLETLANRPCRYTLNQLKDLVDKNSLAAVYDHLIIFGGTLDRLLLNKFKINSSELKSLPREIYNQKYGSFANEILVIRDGREEEIYEVMEQDQEETAENNNNVTFRTLANIHQFLHQRRQEGADFNTLVKEVLHQFGFVDVKELNTHINQFLFNGEIVSFTTLSAYSPKEIELYQGIVGYTQPIEIDRVSIDCYRIEYIHKISSMIYLGKDKLTAVENFLRVEPNSLKQNLQECFGITFEMFEGMMLEMFDPVKMFNFKCIMALSVRAVQIPNTIPYGYSEQEIAASYQTSINNWHQPSGQPYTPVQANQTASVMDLVSEIKHVK